MKRYSVTARKRNFPIVNRTDKNHRIFIGHDRSLKAVVEHLIFVLRLRTATATILINEKAAKLLKNISLKRSATTNTYIKAKPSRLFTNIALHTYGNALVLNTKETKLLELWYLSPNSEKIIISDAAGSSSNLLCYTCLRISDISTDDDGNDNYLSDISEQTLSDISYDEY